MKKTILVLLLTLLICMTACSSDPQNPTEAEAQKEPVTEAPSGEVVSLGTLSVRLPNDSWSGEYKSFAEVIYLKKAGSYYGKDPTISVFFDDTDLESSIQSADRSYSTVEGTDFETEIGGYSFKGNRTVQNGITIETVIERLFYAVSDQKTLRIQLIVSDGPANATIKGVDKNDPEAQEIIKSIIELNKLDQGGKTLEDETVNADGMVDEGEEIGMKWTLDGKGTLRISGSSMSSYMNSGDYPWYQYSKQIKRVEIEDGITEVSQLAFKGYDALESVDIPDSVTKLGLSCFSGCESLKEITLPKNLNEIEFNCFVGCESLTEITIPGTLTHINNYAFNGCTSLKTVRIESGVKSLGYDVFDGCGEIESFYLPKTVTLIDLYSFYDTTIKDLYYEGSESDFNAIQIKDNNQGLDTAKIHYNSAQ